MKATSQTPTQYVYWRVDYYHRVRMLSNHPTATMYSLPETAFKTQYPDIREGDVFRSQSNTRSKVTRVARHKRGT
jgi:hypothetical protein